MNSQAEQEILLKIVETWNPSMKPEYRGFRCANCQKYKNEAWYHWVHTGGYRLPIHMCTDTCEPQFQNGTINIDESKRKQVIREEFNPTYSEKTEKRFDEIIASWPEYKKPELKAYTCDECEQDLDIDTDVQRKGWHVWYKMPDDFTLAELHFHKSCAKKIGL